MTFVNATPHEIVLVRKDGSKLVLSPSGICPRVDAGDTYHVVGDYNGVEMLEQGLGTIVGLPDEKHDVAYIVASMVSQHPDVQDRDDLWSPTDFVRDKDGKILAAKALVQYYS